MSGPLISTFSADDHAVLSDFLADALDGGWWVQRQTVSFLLYLIGEKPAVEFTVLSGRALDSDAPILADDVPPESVCNGFLALVSKLDVPHHRRPVSLNGGFTAVYYECVSDTADSLPEPQATGDTATFHREWGDHYGYPDIAVEGFITDDCLRVCTSAEDAQQFLQLIEGLDVSWPDVRRTPLTSYVLPASEQGIQETVERGLQYESALRQAAVDYDYPRMARLVDTVIDEFDAQFAGSVPAR